LRFCWFRGAWKRKKTLPQGRVFCVFREKRESSGKPRGYRRGLSRGLELADRENLFLGGLGVLGIGSEVQGKQSAVERACGASQAGVLRLMRKERKNTLLWSASPAGLNGDQVRAGLGSSSPIDGGSKDNGPQGRGTGANRRGGGLRESVHKSLTMANNRPAYMLFDVLRVGRVVFSLKASRSFAQVTSSASGSTRVSAVTVMKLVSPTQRGSAC
jgi:hypothetical protein